MDEERTNGGRAFLIVFEFTGGGGGPRHLHYDQDEWIYVIDGKIDILVGETRLRLGAGESVFIPRKVPHGWGCVSGTLSKIINVYHLLILGLDKGCESDRNCS